jgi:GTP-binding protein
MRQAQRPPANWFRAAGDLDSLPPDHGVEVAFVGRSNSGKSSAINAITGRKRLAFVSKRPGRTQTINFFSWGDARYLVDLPGYGYAAVPARQAREWGKLISAYLASRHSLRGLVVVMDARHPFMGQDCMLLDWAMTLDHPVLVLLSKSDKLSHAQAVRALGAGRAFLAERYPQVAIQLFSATSGLGLPAARASITRWLARGHGTKKPPAKGE